MSVPSDTLSDDLYELPAWYCMVCRSRLVGEMKEDLYVARCECNHRQWYIPIPKRAGYFLENYYGSPQEGDKEVADSKQPAGDPKPLRGV